jgi:predicted porin
MEIYRMKKSLLAVAAMTAFAGAAQAQSSVTVYGILDVGFAGGSSTVNNSNSPSGYTSGVQKVTGNQFSESAEQTSRLGFKGTEDLGGGTSAFFTAEFALYPQDATLSGNTNNGLYNRQTFVGLKKNGLGQASAGLQYTPVFDAALATDAGQFNNVVGDVIYSSGTAAGGGGSGPSASNIGFTNRVANSLKLQSDSFGGFRFNAMLTDNNKNATQSAATVGGNTNASGWGLGADYTRNKLFVTAQYQALKQLTTATDVTPDGSAAIWTNSQGAGLTAVPGSPSNLTSASNIQDNQFFAGATYDFGILKAYAQYVNRKATSQYTSNYYLSRSAEQIGVRSYITPTIEAWASAGLGRYTAYGNTNPTANFNAFQLGTNYWLSKRTNLYAIYGQANTSNAYIGNAPTGLPAPNATAPGTVSYNINNYAIGVRHTF